MKQSIIKKTMVIAPHEDDEINLIGTVIDQLLHAGVEVSVVFVTNGDYEPSKTKIRMQETQKVLRKMGFYQTFFLGYGDCADGSTHMFNAQEVPLCSRAGHIQTYSIGKMHDFRFLVSGRHSEYRRECLKEDMLDCIFQEHADLLICVDLDSHPDHRMTSIIFEEVIHDLVTSTDYRPIVLKRFAYAGTWHGAPDYFHEPMLPTILKQEEYFPYAQQQEIRVKTNEVLYSSFFWKSKVYKWCRIYRSQQAAKMFWNIVNSDTLFFFRDTYNLALQATVVTSSGEGKYLNDFKLYDSDNVSGRNIIDVADFPRYTWIPAKDDLQKQVIFEFVTPIDVETLVFYQSHDKKSRIKTVQIKLDNGYCKESKLKDGLYTSVVFPIKHQGIRQIAISILESEGPYAGFREIEMFDYVSEFPWREVPFEKFQPEAKPSPRKLARLMQCLMNFREFVDKDLKTNGIKYFIKRFLIKIKKKLN